MDALSTYSEAALQAVSPFVTTGQWFKGNLHTHTTESDGACSPEENIRWHERNGYDFLSITDHNHVTDVRGLDDLKLLTLPGTELSLGNTCGGGPFHLVVFGLPPCFQPPPASTLSARAGIELINSVNAGCFVAHPHWSSTTMEELAELSGYVGIEVYNTGCDRENRTGLAEPYWDDLLRRGRSVWGFATDDSHWQSPDQGGGWIMVKAPERSGEAILAAIKAGHFYASCGPTIEHVTLQDGVLHVRCSPVCAIYWSEGRRGGSVHAEGDELLDGAEFEVSALRYLRVQIVDADGRWAWSNPIFVEEGE